MNIGRIDFFPDVVDWQLCCGCGVCTYLYPDNFEMVDVKAVGRRPKFTEFRDNKLESCRSIGVCPGLRLAHHPENLEQEGLISALTKTWGPILEIWEAYAGDPEICYKGSSGGAITAISLYCLEREEMSGVLHVIADQAKPYLNATIFSTNKTSLLSGAGSRYSPASPCERLGEIEESTGESVIVGKPCDIAAVQNVRKFRERLNDKIGLTIACFCAGTPSTNGTLEMLRQMGVDEPDDISSLRYRGHGWPGKTKAKRKIDHDAKKYRDLSYEQSWGEILQEYRQWRCYICPDHTGEFADISVGDPWYKEKQAGDQGRSLILVRSQKGKEVLKGAIAKGYLIAEKKEAQVLPASQPNLQKTRSRLWGQLTALKLLGVPCPEYSGFSLMSNWKEGLSVSEKVKSILGTMKRVYVKELNKKQDYLS